MIPYHIDQLQKQKPMPSMNKIAGKKAITMLRLTSGTAAR